MAMADLPECASPDAIYTRVDMRSPYALTHDKRTGPGRARCDVGGVRADADQAATCIPKAGRAESR